MVMVKAESISAIIVAVLLFIVGLEIAISSIKAFSQELEPPKGITIFAVVLSIVERRNVSI